jgi:hypothetical protein
MAWNSEQPRDERGMWTPGAAFDESAHKAGAERKGVKVMFVKDGKLIAAAANRNRGAEHAKFFTPEDRAKVTIHEKTKNGWVVRSHEEYDRVRADAQDKQAAKFAANLKKWAVK